jgi:hypothetical protein
MRSMRNQADLSAVSHAKMMFNHAVVSDLRIRDSRMIIFLCWGRAGTGGSDGGGGGLPTGPRVLHRKRLRRSGTRGSARCDGWITSQQQF